jgi:hypothetical protein
VTNTVELANCDTVEIDFVKIEKTGLNTEWIDQDVPAGSVVLRLMNGDSHEYILVGDTDAFMRRLVETYMENYRERHRQ